MIVRVGECYNLVFTLRCQILPMHAYLSALAHSLLWMVTKHNATTSCASSLPESKAIDQCRLTAHRL